MKEDVIDNEMVLFDRLNVIRDTNKKYDLENNAYISFSGGKDSVVLHHLIDLALPDNQIPRVYCNTGIEYSYIADFVKEIAKKDNRVVIIQPKKNIKRTLEDVGYPFKSKEHSRFVHYYQNNKKLIEKYIDEIKKDESLLESYDYIHNLPFGVKSVIKYIYGKREREREVSMSLILCPNKLKYQFTDDLQIGISDKCCYEMKEKPLRQWEKENNKFHKILGLRKSEGGRRAIRGGCKTFVNNKLTFSPLYVVSDDWEKWFIEKLNIKLCDLYYEPFNFKRTGCKGCPFALDLQEQLDIMKQCLPSEAKQCEIIWKPVYEEYRRLGYRLRKDEGQMTIFDFM